MAQIFVPRNDLLVEDAQNPVRIFAAYSETPAQIITLHGSQYTVLIVGDNYVVNDVENARQILDASWRNNYLPVINAEAARRINLAFPQFKQMNYNAMYNSYQSQYGTDTTMWPTEAQTFLAEYQRGWQFVSDVRSVANSISVMPADPTADEHWPPQISPIQ